MCSVASPAAANTHAGLRSPKSTLPPVTPPVGPMLAKSVKSIPDGDYLYEPKWDGFRCIAFRDGDEVELSSRGERPLTRYFPEVVAAVKEQLLYSAAHPLASALEREGELQNALGTSPDHREATAAFLRKEQPVFRGRGGREGVHTEAMGFLLAEMQHLHRTHPGVSW